MKWHGVLILTGDFNIDLLGCDKESTRRYKDILHSFSLQQHITKPTRKSKTIIDHICSNIAKRVVHEDVVLTDEISDHDTPSVVFNIKKELFEPRYKFIRNEKNLDMNRYINDFQQLPLSLVYSFDDPEDQINILNKLIADCINEHSPLRRVKLTRPIAPWMNDPKITSLHKSMETLRKQYQLTKLDSDQEHYRDARNTLKKTIKNCKACFLRNALSAKQPKHVWNTVNRILNKQHSRTKHQPTDLNNYFSTQAARLTNKENKPTDYNSFFDSLVSDTSENDSFVIKPTNFTEVRKIIMSLKNDCSTGFDGIPVKYLKPVVDHLTSPLVHIINTSINQNVFPKSWKIARVCPIPKIDQPTELKDYRPISILSVLSKVYERIILTQLTQFIERKALYNSTQSGYRKGHSTVTLLLKLRDDIRRAMNKSEVTLAILIDYSKAFDTIDHKKLLLKLNQMGFSKKSIEIIHSYLTERNQFVQIDDKVSNLAHVYYGVPQGSILGPVLFNLYVIDSADILRSHSVQYADDITLYEHSKVKDIGCCVSRLEEDLARLSNWSKDQNLVFNDSKTKLLLFSTSQMH